MKAIITIIFITSGGLCLAQIDTSKFDVFFNGIDSIITLKPTKADKERQAGNLDAAVNEYKNQIHDDSTIAMHIYNLAATYSLLYKKDSAFKYLLKIIEKDSSIMCLSDPDFYNISKDKRWAKLQDAQINKHIQKKGIKYKDLGVLKELFTIQMKDQAYYFEIQIATDKDGLKSKSAQALWDKKAKLDKENLKSVKKIIRKQGWLKSSEYGGIGPSTIFLVIQHADLKAQKKYFPLLEELCKSGEPQWDNYAYLKDRILVSENKPQIYGTQVKYNEKTNSYELFPIEDPEHLDKRRKEIGLEPINFYLMNYGITFDVIQKE